MLFKRLSSTLKAFKTNWWLVKRELKVMPISLILWAFLKNSQYIILGNHKAQDRLKVCGTCEYNSENFCLLCGCHIPGIVLDKKEKCLAERWKA